MEIQRHVSLQDYNTFGFDVHAEYFVSAYTSEDIVAAVAWARQNAIPVFVLGGGSNIVLTKNIPGLVIFVSTTGVTVVNETEALVELSVQAGENWHGFVNRCIANGYYGVENLSLIPGKIGAAPIQNIGAYGVELSEVFVSLDAIDLHSGEQIRFTKTDCQFGYRDSIFKHEVRGEKVITAVQLKLDKKFSPKLHYDNIQQLIDQRGLSSPNARDLANIVCDIRRQKLPDPKRLGNVGSFFTNPIVDAEKYKELKARFPDLVAFPVKERQFKLAAGWLVEYCGWKGRQSAGVGVHDKQALVLVNYGAGNGPALIALAKKIRASVYETFGVRLEAEPLVL